MRLTNISYLVQQNLHRNHLSLEQWNSSSQTNDHLGCWAFTWHSQFYESKPL